MHIQVAENSRTFVGGGTGRGKTVFCIELLSKVERLAVIDVKGNLSERMNLKPYNRRNLRKFIGGEPMRLQFRRYRDAKTKLSESDYYEDIFGKILLAGDCMVFIDEVLMITNGSQDLLPNMKEVYVVGREPVYIDDKWHGGNIGVVASSQRPANMPLYIMTESSNFAAFGLMNPDDRIKLAGYMGQEVREIAKDKHGFWWLEDGATAPVYVPELPLSEAISG